MAHDDHFHCYAFPPGVTPGKSGSAVRKDTWKRAKKLPPETEFYSLTDDLKALEAAQNKKLKGSAKLESLGKTPGGRELHVLKLGANAVDKPKKARVLFTAGLHAREWIAPTYTYLIAEWLVTNYPAGKPASKLEGIAKTLIDENHVWFVPMCNPDGHEYSVTTLRGQRKGSPGGDDHFLPVIGNPAKRDPKAPDSIDLNRNFNTRQWSKVVGSGVGSFSTDPNEETYCGKAPGEAAEVKLLQAMIDKVPFDLAVDHHSFNCSLLYPYGDDPGKAKEDTRLVAYVNAMKKQIDAKAALAKNATTQPTGDTWGIMKISDYYRISRAALGITITPAESVLPGSITDYLIYAAEGASRKGVAVAMELPPTHHPGTPGFDPPEAVIQPTFRAVIGTSLALIANAQNLSPKDADFTPFDAVAP